MRVSKDSGYADNLRNNGGERRSRMRASLRLLFRRVVFPVCRGPSRKILLNRIISSISRILLNIFPSQGRINSDSCPQRR
jgi:hypothetical protein